MKQDLAIVADRRSLFTGKKQPTLAQKKAVYIESTGRLGRGDINSGVKPLSSVRIYSLGREEEGTETSTGAPGWWTDEGW